LRSRGPRRSKPGLRARKMMVVVVMVEKTNDCSGGCRAAACREQH
jgi:hypothetical protein